MPKGISERLMHQRRKIAADVERLGDRCRVARKWGCSRAYVDRCAQESGVHPYHTLSHEDVVRMVYDLCTTDKPYGELAEDYDVASPRVGNIARYARAAGFKMAARPVGRPRKPRFE